MVEHLARKGRWCIPVGIEHQQIGFQAQQPFEADPAIAIDRRIGGQIAETGRSQDLVLQGSRSGDTAAGTQNHHARKRCVFRIQGRLAKHPVHGIEHLPAGSGVAHGRGRLVTWDRMPARLVASSSSSTGMPARRSICVVVRVV